MTPSWPCAAALALSIGLLPLVPAEHVHESVSVAGHHDVVAHRHLGPHHIHSAFDDRAPSSDHDLFRDNEDHSRDDEDHDADRHADHGGDRVEPGPAAIDLVAQFDDDDSVVATEDGLFVAARTYTLAVLALASQPATPVADGLPAAGPGELVERLIHGPPRAPTLLRGPPSLSHL